MGIEDNKNIHDFNLTRIDDAVSRQKLYLIDFKDHQIQQKKGFGYLFARLRHVIYSIVDRTGDKNLAIEKQQFQTLFEKNKELLNPQAEQIPKKSLFTGKPYSNSKLIERINIVFQQLNGREKVAGDLFVMHTDFQKRFGEVSIENGVPMPTLKQLKAAFSLAEPLQTDFDMSTAQTRAAYARAIQTIMLGPAAADLPMPEDDICFTCKELKAVELSEFETDYMDGIEWQLKDSSYYKGGRDRPANKTPQGMHEALLDYTKQFFMDFCRGLHPTNTMKQEYSETTSKDVNGTKVKLSIDEKRMGIFSSIRTEFLEALNDPSFMRRTKNYTQIFRQSFGFPPDFDHKQCLTLIRDSLKEGTKGAGQTFSDEWIEEFLKLFTFSDESDDDYSILADFDDPTKKENVIQDYMRQNGCNREETLRKLSELKQKNDLINTYKIMFDCDEPTAKSQLNDFLIFHLLRLSVLTNQSLLAFNAQTDPQLIQAGLSPSGRGSVYSYNVHPDVFFTQARPIYSVKPEIISNLPPNVTKDHGGMFIYVLRMSYGGKIPSLTGKIPGGKVVVEKNIRKDIRVSPFAKDVLEKVIQKLNAQDPSAGGT